MSHRFKNRYISKRGSGISGREARSWLFSKLAAKQAKIAKNLIPAIAPDLDLIHNIAENAVQLTWIGHATFLLQIGKVNILTDPHFSNRASPFSFIGPKRHQPPGVAISELPFIHYVLLSHNHYDHLDYQSTRILLGQNPQPHYLIPAKLDSWFFANTSIKSGCITSFNWFQTEQVGDFNFHFLPVQHWSKRSLMDTCDTLWGSFLVTHPQLSFWFSGDLGFSRDIHDINQYCPNIDIATIPIGAYKPEIIMKHSHLNPNEAVDAFSIIKPKQAVAHHWGTFENLTDEPLDEPPKLLAQALKIRDIDPGRFKVMCHGQTLTWNKDQLN